jgi:DNA-binding response OmpR family regulator
MQADKRAAPKRRLSIFIADDHPDTLLTLAAVLRDDGHIVHTCADARICVELIQRYEPEVCILDVVMPGVSGWQIAREVRAAHIRQPVLIAMSGQFTKASDKLLAQAVGFDHFLVKAADPRELLDIIDLIATREGPAAA